MEMKTGNEALMTRPDVDGLGRWNETAAPTRLSALARFLHPTGLESGDIFDFGRWN